METQAVAIDKYRAEKFEALVERIYREQNSFQGFEGTLESVLRVHFSKMSAQNHLWKRDTFRELLLTLYTKRCYAVLRNPAYIEVLANMSAFGNKKVRAIADWKKDSLTAHGQLASIIRHCFAQYEVPEFMEHVFSAGSKVHMLWYIQLGRGDSVQGLSGFPVKFTKAMAHEFRLTPSAYTMEKAIRRAQALGYGASVKRAEGIAWSLLSESFEDEIFRTALVKYFAGVKEDIRFDELQKVLEYVFFMKERDAAFSMKGRTWAALFRQATEWSIEEAKRKAAEGYCDWKPAGIMNFEVIRGEVVVKIIQLVNSEALYEEGYEMSHCVADYADDCADGIKAIFSVRKYAADESFETLATVCVFLEEMAVYEAQARYNEMICKEAHEVIQQWAAREKLTTDYDYYEMSQIPQQAAIVPNNAAMYQPRYEANRNKSDSNIMWIIFFIIKILWLIAKVSQAG